MKIRPYKRKDAQIIASWITSEKEFYEWSAGKMGTYPATSENFEKLSEDIIDDDRYFMMVASENDNIVGFFILRYPGTDNKHVRLGFVLIDPSCRNRGLGASMVRMATSYAFDYLEATRISLGVFEENKTAHRVYRSAGFFDTGAIEKHEINGKSEVCIEMEAFSSITPDAASESVVPEDDLIKDIINDNKLNYALQPIVDASSGEIFGYEALMRVGIGGNVSPMTILDYATRNNRLYDIEKLTLFNVMELYENNIKIFKDKKIFINSLPGSQLTKKDYNKFRERFGKYFNNMVIEITENTEFKDKELGALLDRSSSDGFTLAIDDYGTGYSNTSSLLSYLPNVLKIDRLLISNIHEDSKKQHFVRSIVEFATANGVKTLAEGVETSAELKMAIELGIDLIQGYYTGKPSLEIIDEIDDSVKSRMISYSVKGTNQDVRKIYTVNGEDELPVMRLALEKYTGILVEQEELTLVGNTRYSAEMSIKIKDNTKCRLTIRDVFIESTQQLPCIEIGKKSHLTLILEGDNRMKKFGILVPDDSSLVIKGDGNLQIRSQGVSSYAIGNLWNAGVGDIKWQGKGSLDILVEADEGVGIGGGEFNEGSGISLESGMVRIEPASGKAVSLGAAKGSPLININKCKLQLDIKVEAGVGIGCIEGEPDIRVESADINILCAGSKISAIGGLDRIDGNIDVHNSEIAMLGNGQQIFLIGSTSGDLKVKFDNSAINLRGEGNNVLAVGTKDHNSEIYAKQTIINIKLASGSPIVYGAKPEKTVFSGGLQSISVNE